MFERMTRRTEGGIAYTKIPANPSNMVDVGECYTGRIIDRLAAYEDTRLTPERIRELQNAFNILFESERQKQQENEQLQAQVARVREALRKAREAIKAAWSDGSANAAMDKASEALAEIDKAIGGKAFAEVEE